MASPPELVTAPPGARTAAPRRTRERFAALIPVSLVVLGASVPLQASPGPYDGGLLLTLARFAGWARLPYRDLWTLYGPGPPYFGAAIMEVFGPGLLPVRIAYVVLHALLVIGVFLVSARFVRPWIAAMIALPVATFAYSPAHFHFAGSIALILWGLWFVLRAEDHSRRRRRRILIGAVLIGTSFWGRYELVVLAVVLVVVLWWLLRRRLGPEARWMVVAGLVPPVLFLLYLTVVVGWDRTSLNLIDYPFSLYPRSYCRGLPDAWGPALEALVVPFTGRVWSGYELTLALGTFAPPILAVATAVAGIRLGSGRPLERAAVIALAIATMFVWLEMRPRASTEPHPTWPLALTCGSVLFGRIRQVRVRALALAIPGLVFSLVFAVSWLPPVLSAWGQWPSFDRVYGFSHIEEDWVFDRAVWGQVTQTVHRYAGPEEPIFVGLQNNRGHFANFPIFYWVTDRPPVSRFIEFNPCLTDTREVQEQIVRDLAATNVVVATAHFPEDPPPFAPPPTALDDYLSQNFHAEYTGTLLLEGDISVLIRNGADPHL